MSLEKAPSLKMKKNEGLLGEINPYAELPAPFCTAYP